VTQSLTVELLSLSDVLQSLIVEVLCLNDAPASLKNELLIPIVEARNFNDDVPTFFLSFRGSMQSLGSSTLS
jgi:hypothetical protein